MLGRPITGPRAWQRGTLDPPATWYQTLSPGCSRLLEHAVNDWRRAPSPVTELRAVGAAWTACQTELQPARAALESGRGFVILRGLPQDGYSPQEFQAMYWLVGQLLGRPFAQNVQGTLLYDVRDYGKDVRQGARFSLTNAESSFHTDNSFGEEILDYVGLLCLQPAKTGGLSQMVSVHAVHNLLLEKHREILPELYRPFHVDRRGGVRPGEGPTLSVPVLEWHDELLCRYFRFWIEAGHEKVGQPLTPAQVNALDVFDRVLMEPSLRVEFALERGDMYFMNNRWLLHNRTAFEDYPEPERQRHLVRLWLKAP